MNMSVTEQDKKKVLRLALFAGEIMLCNGGETYRVEDTILRICHSRNIYHVSAFVTPTVIIIADDRHDGFSFMKSIDTRTTNLQKVAMVNNFSREFVKSDIALDDAILHLQAILEKSEYPDWFRVVLCAIASSMFTGMLGGSPPDLLCALVISLIATVTSIKMYDLDNNSFLSNAVSGVIIAILAILSLKSGIGNNMDMIIVGSIMPLLPGVSFTNGLRDFIAGYLISGMSKVFEAAVLAVAIAISAGSVLSIYIRYGGVI